jgi:hypothetical protein
MAKSLKWGDWFVYDETSPSCLRWKKDIWTGRHNNVQKASAGGVAGCLSEAYPNYFRYVIRLKQNNYHVHKIVWELHYGELPAGSMIDHIDGTTSNRIENLRLVSHAENMRNRKKAKNHHTLVTGVNKVSNPNGNFYWRANWVELDGTRKSKHFSVTKLGDEEAFAQAVKYRQSKIEQLNQQGAGYTERHGKEKQCG